MERFNIKNDKLGVDLEYIERCNSKEELIRIKGLVYEEVMFSKMKIKALKIEYKKSGEGNIDDLKRTQDFVLFQGRLIQSIQKRLGELKAIKKDENISKDNDVKSLIIQFWRNKVNELAPHLMDEYREELINMKQSKN